MRFVIIVQGSLTFAMNRHSLCPHCAHCRTLREMEEEAVKRRDAMEEERKRMEKEIEEAERMIREQGAIYGHQYDMYTVEDIQRITNYEFLCDMLANMIPAGQPTTEDECRDLGERYGAADKRCQELLHDMV